MAFDLELIENSNFNHAFKNHLQNLYIYQFKEQQEIFASAEGEHYISKSSAYHNVLRLRKILSEAAGIRWLTGKEAGTECFTADAGALPENPFHKLYECCAESTKLPGMNFAFFYMMLLLLHPALPGLRPLPEGVEEAFLREANEALAVDCGYGSYKEFKARKKKVAESRVRAAMEMMRQRHPEFRAALQAGAKDVVFDPTALSFAIAPLPERRQHAEDIAALYTRLDRQMSDAGNIKKFKLKDLKALGLLGSSYVSAGPDRGETFFLADAPFDRAQLAALCPEEGFLARFSAMLSFFTETAPLGVIGSFLQKRLGRSAAPFTYKDRHLQAALRDYNLIDILAAIQKGQWLEIQYRSELEKAPNRIVCYPLEVRENLQNGRSYLVYYSPAFESVSALRLGFIDELSIGAPKAIPEHLSEKLALARHYIRCAENNAFPRFREGNLRYDPAKSLQENIDALPLLAVEITIAYAAEDDFMPERITRYVPFGAELRWQEHSGRRLCTVCCKTADLGNLLPWLLNFAGRILKVTVDGKPCDRWLEDLRRNLEQYELPPLAPRPRTFHALQILDTIPFEKDRSIPPHQLLFHDFFSFPMEFFGKLLADHFRGALPGDLREYICANIHYDAPSASESNRIEKLTAQAENLLAFFAEGMVEGSALPENLFSLFPLTLPEAEWLHCILHSAGAALFLTPEEIAALKAQYPARGLFTLEPVCYMNQNHQNDLIASPPERQAIFRTLLTAIQNGRAVSLTYRRREELYTGTYAPERIEFSKRDGRFRLFAQKNGRPFTLNLHRIEQATCLPEAASLHPITPAPKAQMTVIFGEERNLPDRLLTEFAPFEKTCTRSPGGLYRMTLSYDPSDYKELAIRLVTYGSGIRIETDSGDAAADLIARLNAQLELSRQNEREEPDETL